LVGALPQQLTATRQRDLLAGDLDARRELVTTFLPAIAGLAARFPRGAGIDRDELVQDGVAGLLLAARRFDPRRNTPFWAYASFWVRKAMQELVAELTGPVALSDRAVRDLARLRTARSEHMRLHGAEPTVRDLSRATGFSTAQIESLEAADRTPAVTGERLRESIADPSAEQAYEHVLDEIEIADVHHLADGLAERERSVLYAHYGVGRPAQTLDEIGDTLGLTGERVRQIEAGALKKLRRAL
jgi:RNA polymerase sigma factor (sigma-70 family)